MISSEVKGAIEVAIEMMNYRFAVQNLTLFAMDESHISIASGIPMVESAHQQIQELHDKIKSLESDLELCKCKTEKELEK
jgi:hypothetical protein